MRPYPFTSTQFNIDEYLDRHKDSAPPLDFPEANHQAALRSITRPAVEHRGWPVRLNDRIERWMDTLDWRRVEIVLGNLGGVLLTGTSLYLIYHLVDAWLQGRFNLGAN
jgi:hypothetical protein